MEVTRLALEPDLYVTVDGPTWRHWWPRVWEALRTMDQPPHRDDVFVVVSQASGEPVVDILIPRQDLDAWRAGRLDDGAFSARWQVGGFA